MPPKLVEHPTIASLGHEILAICLSSCFSAHPDVGSVYGLNACTSVQANDIVKRLTGRALHTQICLQPDPGPVLCTVCSLVNWEMTCSQTWSYTPFWTMRGGALPCNHLEF